MPDEPGVFGNGTALLKASVMHWVMCGIHIWVPCEERPFQHYGWRVGGSSKAWQRGEHEEDCSNIDNVVLVELLANAEVQPARHTVLKHKASLGNPPRCKVSVKMTLT